VQVVNTGAMSNSYQAAMQLQMLWATILQSTSFFMAVSLLDRTPSPNFRLMAEKVDSTLER
jgi:hypothetical protein